MSIVIKSNMIFTPMMINDVMKALKNKAVDITNKTMFTPLYKLLEIIREEAYETNKTLDEIIEDLTIEEIKEMELIETFKQLDDVKINLTKIYETFENSTNIYAIQLAKLTDETLDLHFKLINSLLYLQSKVTKHNLQVS